jgi:subtilisin family serine protease
MAAVLCACATVRPSQTTRPPITAITLPRDWHLLDESLDGVPGISAERAYRELLRGKSPRRTVIVAVIDIGVDTTHPSLRGVFWSNPREIPRNGIDDDHNGYVDDMHGWKFLGGPDGRNIDASTKEIARLYGECVDSSLGSTRSLGPATDCGQITKAYTEAKARAAGELAAANQTMDMATALTKILVRAVGSDSLTRAKLEALKTDNPQVLEARRVWLAYANQGLTIEGLTDWRNDVLSRDSIGLNPRFDPSPIVRDHPKDPWERYYGNPDISIRGMHGTHISGTSAGLPDSGVQGIARGVRIMTVRASCACDERDKDVANAIRYAVDNGANIISMSFIKEYSPQKLVVDSAVKYADAKGVLMVHAAGNSGADIDTVPSFPSPRYLNGSTAKGWIEVAASSWQVGDSLAASFSNYGHDAVDVFAPGVGIYSTWTGGGYGRALGTSMAAPMVTGIAAVLMQYYPQLTAVDVKRIILASATNHRDQLVVRPGSKGERVPFGQLSVSGGIANLYAALRLAGQR